MLTQMIWAAAWPDAVLCLSHNVISLLRCFTYFKILDLLGVVECYRTFPGATLRKMMKRCFCLQPSSVCASLPFHVLI